MWTVKYKRDRYIFISNLNDTTANKDRDISLKREGYLLSEYYTNDVFVALAKWVKKRRNLLISDNGNFSRMKEIAESFTNDGEVLLKKAQKNGITNEIRKERKILMTKIAAHCKKELSNQGKESIIKNQLKIDPDYMIALEDLTVPVMMLCGLLDPTFLPQASEIEKYQKVSVQLYKSQKDGKFGSKAELGRVRKFHVLHSYDFLSAQQAALHIREFKPDGVAVSFGGAMNSNRWIENWNLGDVNITLPEKLPEMYLATAAIGLGYAKGNPADTPVHILGVGSPILVALFGLIFHESRAISIDSTAPFKDAFQSKLYGSRFGFLKMDMYKVAAYALINKEPYSSTTPFFKEFEHTFPHNWDKLRTELGVTSTTSMNDLAELLENETQLVEDLIPFFGKMRAGDDALIKHLRVARAGHNYWILNRICHAIRTRKDEVTKLNKWTSYQIKRYQEVGHPKWAQTIKIIYRETVGSFF